MPGKRLYRHISRLLRESYAYGNHRLATIGVHLGQPALLAAVARGEFANQKDLADSLGLAPSTVNVMLGRMEKSGWVARNRCEDNARMSSVVLLPAGREVLEKIFILEEEMTSETYAGLTAEERRTFVDLADRIDANMKSIRD